MLNSQNYIITDMASEKLIPNSKNIIEENESKNGFSIHRLTVATDISGVANAGKYLTVTVGKPWLEADSRIEAAAETVAELITELCHPFISQRKAVLTVCLGNRNITADAIGPLCADGLISTRHLKTDHPDTWTALGETETAALAPGVSGSTGIEACELVGAVVKTVKPDVVVAIDALSARSTHRLGTSIQLSDTGISPGSGVGNRRSAISRQTLGVPVISIGVPTVAHTVTLLRDAAEAAGITEASKALLAFLDAGRELFVTPKDADLAVKTQADIISRAVNLAFLGFSKL